MLIAIAAWTSGRVHGCHPMGSAQDEMDAIDARNHDASTGKITYWLWNGKKCIGSVRMAPGTSDREAINRAIENEFDFPLGHLNHGLTPFEFRNMLHRATVKTYDDIPNPHGEK
jgi:hypothetical protein